jgi:hypothetical protein
MSAGIFIIAVSLILFVYWFRYSCLMLIRNAAERAGASTAYDERFSVARVMERLKTERELDPLERALERDYHVLAYLIQHAADLELASIENRLLLLDYKLMRVWSHLTRKASPERSRQALTEMASVLGVLVRKMGEQNGMQEA